MTNLEEKIISAAKETIKEIEKDLPEQIRQTKASILRFMYECDGVHDVMDYNIRTGKWTVEYSVGVGKGVFIFSGKAGYYDKVKTKRVEL